MPHLALAHHPLQHVPVDELRPSVPPSTTDRNRRMVSSPSRFPFRSFDPRNRFTPAPHAGARAAACCCAFLPSWAKHVRPHRGTAPPARRRLATAGAFPPCHRKHVVGMAPLSLPALVSVVGESLAGEYLLLPALTTGNPVYAVCLLVCRVPGFQHSAKPVCRVSNFQHSANHFFSLLPSKFFLLSSNLKSYSLIIYDTFIN